MRLIISILLFFALNIFSAEAPTGFQNADWGATPAAVQTAAGVNWAANNALSQQFPPEMGITVYTANSTVAGYSATVDYYFFQNKFFQATVKFNFPELVNFDFNYNVFISVDKYYRTIHATTLTFVNDIYALLQKKYGKKQPVFKGLDPRHTFKYTDRYIKQEVWNLRYHPSEFYKRIVTASYARWDYPKTRIIFSINISAIDKRFDYQLSLVSMDLQKEINAAKDTLRMQGL